MGAFYGDAVDLPGRYSTYGQNMFVLVKISAVRQAWHDPPTRLYNRGALFEKRPEAGKALSWEARQPFSVIQLDLDYLKALTIAFGHQAGDRVVPTYAAGLIGAPFERTTRRTGRGEEFCIALPGATQSAGAADCRTHTPAH